VSVLALHPPPDRGRLLSADQVARALFSGSVTARWVRRTLRAGRVRLGHRTVVWQEGDVLAWIAKRRESAA